MSQIIELQIVTRSQRWNFARSRSTRLSLFLIAGLICLVSFNRAHAGFATSTVYQDGTKTDFNNNLGSASRIGSYDFDFGTELSQILFTQMRIALWVQLPTEAIGDLAPSIVFAKVGTTNLAQALITGDAVRTDVRVSFNLFQSGLGVVHKQTGFENLTLQQGLSLASILASDPSNRVDAWLVSDTLKAITVPAYGESLDFSNGLPTVTIQRFSTTLDLKYVSEPSSQLIFSAVGLFCIRRLWFFRNGRKVSKVKGILE